MFLLILLISSYLFAVNFYAFLTVKTLRNEEREAEIDFSLSSTPSSAKADKKLLFLGAIGGAITVYVCMFAFRFRLKSGLLMVLMPVLGALNAYLVYLAIRYGLTWRI